MEHDPAIQLLRGPSLLRDYAVGGIELRAAEDPASPMVTFVGHASVTDRAYPMYGGADNGFPGYDETVASGAFKKTLSEKPDVAFLVNHGGMTLARTKAGTLRLAEDKIGLATEADLNRQVSVVNDMALLMEAKNLDEMSFAFRVVKETWTNADGEFRRWWEEDALYRTINEVSLNKGDVSVVNYGANPYTNASLRALTDAFSLAASTDDIRSAIADLQKRVALLTPDKPVTVTVNDDTAEKLGRLLPAGGGHIFPANSQSITIAMPRGSDGQEIVDALKEYERRKSIDEWRCHFEQQLFRGRYAA